MYESGAKRTPKSKRSRRLAALLSTSPTKTECSGRAARKSKHRSGQENEKIMEIKGKREEGFWNWGEIGFRHRGARSSIGRGKNDDKTKSEYENHDRKAAETAAPGGETRQE